MANLLLYNMHLVVLVVIRHNELPAELLSEVCTDVGSEPAFQIMDGEPLLYATVNQEDGARLDATATNKSSCIEFSYTNHPVESSVTNKSQSSATNKSPSGSFTHKQITL